MMLDTLEQVIEPRSAKGVNRHDALGRQGGGQSLEIGDRCVPGVVLDRERDLALLEEDKQPLPLVFLPGTAHVRLGDEAPGTDHVQVGNQARTSHPSSESGPPVSVGQNQTNSPTAATTNATAGGR